MEYCYNLAEKTKQNLIYFCEDDYFHLKTAIPSFFDAYNNRIIGSNNFCIHPSDYPDRYLYLEPAYIFINNYNHWRSILHTTGTFVIPTLIFRKYKKYCFDFAKYNTNATGGENETINKIWQKVPCIAPIESLAAHLNEDTLPPFVNWEKLIKNIII